MERTSCKICISAFGEGRTPCWKCKPELNPSNQPYITLFYYCCDQYIVGPSGPVGLNMLAIDLAMDDYKISQDERIDFSSTVRNIANMVFNFQAEKAEQDLKKK